jgi:minor extracellular protease Epr
MRISLLVALFALSLLPGPAALFGLNWLPDGGAAFAQDDDDDDDGGGDDDDDDGGGGGGGGGGGSDDDDDDDDRPTTRNDDDDDDAPAPRTQRRTQPRTAPPPVVAQPLPTRVAREIVALDLSDEDLALLLTRGYRVVEEREVPRLGTTSRRLRAPDGLPLAEARAEVRALASGEDADFNHFYRSEQDVVPAASAEARSTTLPCDGAHCPAFEQIGWTPATLPAAQCGNPVIIGMVDTGVNPDHATFANASLDVIRLTDAKLDPSRAIHGTAVAAILVGDPASRSPGLVPQMPLIAVDVFHLNNGDERADAFSLIEAIGLLADRGARVINLSLAGPPNTVLEEAIARLTTEDGIIFVAAAGNGGPKAKPAYPAAYDTVIAVTAIDKDSDIYRRAGRGPHIGLAAPGVDVWTAASISGAKPKTGTSFAAPFVSAAVALILQAEPALTPDQVRGILLASAKDLGEPAFDPVYGHGLVQLMPHARQQCGAQVE